MDLVILLTHRRLAERKVVATTFPWGSIGDGDICDVDRDGFGIEVRIVRTRPHIAAAGVSVGVL